MKVNLFIPCFIDQFYPETAINTVKVLERAGVEVVYNPNQTCCGQPAFNAGHWDKALPLAEKFLSDFDNDLPIVAPSASCTSFVKQQYPKLSKNDNFLKRHNDLKNRLFELTDFLVNILKISDLGAVFNEKITYHDSCTALRHYGIKEEPRILLSKVKGLELIEMKDADVCCGFGGTFSAKYKAISTAMVEQKVENAIATGAKYIVSTESSCLLNIHSYIRKNNSPIGVKHIADILAAE